MRCGKGRIDAVVGELECRMVCRDNLSFSQWRRLAACRQPLGRLLLRFKLLLLRFKVDRCAYWRQQPLNAEELEA